jgi:hypothetical protein
LPGTTPEETKGAQTFMVGNHEEFARDIRSRLEDVELNALEEGLLQRYLQNQETCA